MVESLETGDNTAMRRLSGDFGERKRAWTRRATCIVLVAAASAAWAQERPAQPDQGGKPGVMESIGRWFDETGASMRKSFDDTWRKMGGMSSSAGSVAKGAADVTKDTVDAIGKLGTSRVISGRERCALAPNGAPDCRLAAETLCRANGFKTGSSVDYQTAEVCPPQAYAGGRQPRPGECPLEHVVTKAMCQ